MEQIEITLKGKSRGFHLVTSEILEQLGSLPTTGILNLFIKHTSAGITLNENADPDVQTDFAAILDRIVPENLPFLKHTMEGPDDMPAHVKASLVGYSINIPISQGKLNMGTWQGIYLGEFRNWGGNRKLVATIFE